MITNYQMAILFAIDIRIHIYTVTLIFMQSNSLIVGRFWDILQPPYS